MPFLDGEETKEPGGGYRAGGWGWREGSEKLCCFAAPLYSPSTSGEGRSRVDLPSLVSEENSLGIFSSLFLIDDTTPARPGASIYPGAESTGAGVVQKKELVVPPCFIHLDLTHLPLLVTRQATGTQHLVRHRASASGAKCRPFGTSSRSIQVAREVTTRLFYLITPPSAFRCTRIFRLCVGR